MNPLVKMAIRAGAADLVRFHLRRGDQVNLQDDSGASLLMYAAARSHAEICRILLDAGADPFLKNHQGHDALALACSAGHHAAEAILLEAVSTSVEEEEFDPFGWIAETDEPPPEGDPDCLNEARALNQLLAGHIPVDTDTD